MMTNRIWMTDDEEEGRGRWRRHAPCPVDVPREERMPLDLVCAARSQAARRISLEEARHDTLRLVRDVVREYEGVRQDPLVHDVHVLVVERWEARLWDQTQTRRDDQHCPVGDRARRARGRSLTIIS